MIKTFFRYNWKGLLWALFILGLCGIPGSDIPHFDLMDLVGFDKLGHATVFLVLMLLGCTGLERQYQAQQKRSKVVLPVLIFGLSYGVITEWLQGTVFVERSADLLDIIANSVGCFAGIWLYNRYFKRRSGTEISSNV